ncbi:MAG: HesA/MoeB/ThiF family protein [Geobacteraceae bacterium]|nr:HesA/MoeB/ThiF family protein [Geobacteraceae bacterium]
MNKLIEYLHGRCINRLLSWNDQVEASRIFNMPITEIETVTLGQGILPARYQRNRSAISVSDQLILHQSCVAIIGCGGLGGYVIEELARLGVGQLVVIDPDIFEEHNLNRQLLSSTAELGSAKVEVAVRRVGLINPAITVKPHQTAFNSTNGHDLLESCALAVDALDNIESRLQLAGCCSAMNIPMVHGAIAGWYGHVTTILPDDTSLQNQYSGHGNRPGIEQDLGNPAFTPAVVASMQVAEACKLLLGRESSLHNRTVMIDLLSMERHEIPR